MKFNVEEAVERAAALSVFRKRVSTLQPQRIDSHQVLGVCLSRDRALQLDALLRSFRRYVTGDTRLTVIYHATTSQHAEAYDDVIRRHSQHGVGFLEESGTGGFRETVLRVVGASTALVNYFLMDDCIFTRRCELIRLASWSSAVCVPTLRHGASLSRNEVQDRQALPRFIIPSSQYASEAAGMIFWRWSSGSFAWSFPLALDGHLFQRSELLDMMRGSSFSSPNSLETALQGFSLRFRPRFGVSAVLPSMVNSPLNVVRAERENLYGSIHQDSLLDAWRSGLQMSIDDLGDYPSTSTHELLPLRMEPRAVE